MHTFPWKSQIYLRNATPVLKMGICGIDDGINIHLRDITFDYLNGCILKGNVLDSIHHSSGSKKHYETEIKRSFTVIV